MFRSVNLHENNSFDETNQTRGFSNGDPNEAKGSSCENKPQQTREITVNMLIRDFILCITLALTTYGALHNIPPKVSRPPQPSRFFSTFTPVIDLYRGELNKALDHISQYDVTFVMFYAPWDAESQYVREHITTAAYVLRSTVHFAAVNCWEPAGECRKAHKIPSWPILMAYTSAKKGVLYQGPHDTHSIVRFLDLIMRPLTRVATTADLVNLLATCDAVVVGFTPLNDTNRYYNLFYWVALQMKTYDHEGALCFGAVTSNSLAKSLSAKSVPSVRIMTYNNTLDYKWNVNKTTEKSLTNWILKNVDLPSMRLIPSWTKSTSFDSHISHKRPMLLLFTPLNSLYPQQPAYDLLREVAMEYSNCNDNQWTHELQKLQRVQRSLYQQTNLMDFCSSINTDEYPPKSVLNHYREKLWRNISNSKERGESFFKKLLDVESNVFKMAQSDSSVGCDSCYFSSGGHCSRGLSDGHLHQFEAEEALLDDLDDYVTPFDSESDQKSAKNLMKKQINHICNLVKFAQTRYKQIYPKKSDTFSPIIGLGCTNNVTLTFLALDSIKNHHFAESLGLNLNEKKDLTALVILDSKAETQYVLDQDYSESSIREFISNYTLNMLHRTLRSSIKGNYTHYYNTNSAEVEELNSNTFLELVKQSGGIRLIMICDATCPALVSLSIKSAARALQQVYVGEQICAVKLGRLDLRKNDLPWQYTPPRLPAVMVVSSENLWRTYPTEERITTEGVLALISSITPRMRSLRISLAAIFNAKSQKTKLLIFKDMKETIASLIQKSLKQWRSLSELRLRQIILRRLQVLRSLWLKLEVSSTMDIYRNSEVHLFLVNMLDSLERNYKVGLDSFIDNNSLLSFNSNSL